MRNFGASYERHGRESHRRKAGPSVRGLWLRREHLDAQCSEMGGEVVVITCVLW
jgi:hypothetical protein